MTDAFDRLKKRQRASVPPRDASLVKSKNDEMTEFSHFEMTGDQLNGSTVNLPSPVADSSKLSSTPTRPDITDSLPEPEDVPEAVRRTLRIEAAADEGLEQLCRQEKITREVFIEAAYLVSLENQLLMEQILQIAKARYQKRKAAGERRKFMTLSKKHQ